MRKGLWPWWVFGLRVHGLKSLGGSGPFYTGTTHMPGTEALTVLWTRATRLPQTGFRPLFKHGLGVYAKP